MAIIKPLINAVNTNQAFSFQTTPLHLAASKGHVQVVNLLISSHADVGAKDTNNLNCLDMAIENGHK